MIATPITEGKEVTAEGVKLELFLNQHGQPPHLLPEVDNISAQVHTDLISEADHE